MNRVRLYLMVFGLAGVGFITLGNYGGGRVGEAQAVAPLMWMGQGGQFLACLGYLYASLRLKSLTEQQSQLPRRLIQSSMLCAVVVALSRALHPYWSDHLPNVLLPPLLNVAYNVPLLGMVGGLLNSAAPGEQGPKV